MARIGIVHQRNIYGRIYDHNGVCPIQSYVVMVAKKNPDFTSFFAVVIKQTPWSSDEPMVCFGHGLAENHVSKYQFSVKHVKRGDDCGMLKMSAIVAMLPSTQSHDCGEGLTVGSSNLGHKSPFFYQS